MEYKRLTNNNLDEYNPEYDFCVGCKHFGEPNGCNRPNGTCANYERFIETYNRLAELEDKIETKRLFELPCKVGDTVYYYKAELDETCPICGGTEIQRLRRVTGYLTGDYKTAFNAGKQQEVEMRYQHSKKR